MPRTLQVGLTGLTGAAIFALRAWQLAFAGAPDTPAPPTATAATPAATCLRQRRQPAATPTVPFTNGKVADRRCQIAICSSCHGPNGNSVNPEWPRLPGRRARCTLPSSCGACSTPACATNPIHEAAGATLSDQRHQRSGGLLRGADPDRPGGGPFLLAGGRSALPARRSGARGSGMRCVPRTRRARQSRSRLSGATRPAGRLRREAAQ